MGVFAEIGDAVGDVLDVIFEDIIGGFIDFFVPVLDAIADGIADLVEEVGGYIGDVLDWGASNPILVAMIVVLVFAVVVPAIEVAFAEMAALTAGEFGLTMTTADIIYWGAYTFIETLAASWSAFATAIHFTTLMSINSIGMLVSVDYRQLVTNIFYEISKASSALGFSADFMSIMLMNTRNVVLDATTTLGMGYDLSEIQWIGEMNTFLKRVSFYANEYKNNPYGLMADLQDLIQKPYIDVKANYMQKLFISLDTIIKSLAAFAEDVDTTFKSTEKWLIDLYQLGDVEWAGKLGKRVGKLEAHIAAKIFVPLTLLENAFTILTADQKREKARLHSLQNRLAFPGDYLSEVNNMSDTFRISQEDKIADISSRKYVRQIAETETFVQTEQTAHLRILDILDQVILPVQWLVPELETPIRPASVAATPRKTWFVGDF